MVAAEKRILVVDDEEIVRDSCKRVLTEAGYTVRTAASGRDALRACRDERFDVMLTDLRMPDMNGIDVIRAVASEFPEVRVIVITGYPSPQSAQQARELGVSDYLEKPLSTNRLSEAAAAALAHPPVRRAAPVPSAAMHSQVPLSAAPQPRQRVEAVVGPAPEPAKRSPHATLRLVVFTAMGFLAGLLIAYKIAPTQGLAYLLVGTAIASGTLVGLFSDVLFAREARSRAPHPAEATCQAVEGASEKV